MKNYLYLLMFAFTSLLHWFHEKDDHDHDDHDDHDHDIVAYVVNS